MPIPGSPLELVFELGSLEPLLLEESLEPSEIPPSTPPPEDALPLLVAPELDDEDDEELVEASSEGVPPP